MDINLPVIVECCLSLELQATIGFGTRAPTDQCYDVIIIQVCKSPHLGVKFK